MFSVNTFLSNYWCWMCLRFYSVCILNTVLILICPCATQSKSARFLWFFFLLYFTTCFGLLSHHHKYRMFSRSLHCFLFDILDASRCFMQVMLRHAFVSNHVFGLCLLSMLRFVLRVSPCIFCLFRLYSHLLNCLPVSVGWEEILPNYLIVLVFKCCLLISFKGFL
jgi:hypothetical protein